jgi:aspartyl-tRNA(Asn)/glutamyl-tRNA(Gln) amidotransferase subunit A
LTRVPWDKNYLNYLKNGGLKNKRIGIVRRVGEIDPFEGITENNMAIFQESFQRFSREGAILISDVQLSEFINNRKDNQAGEIQDVNNYFKNTSGFIKTFKDICMSDKTRNFGDQEKCLGFMESIPIKNSLQYNKVLAIFNKNKNYVEKLMNKYKLDALLIPISKEGIATYNGNAVNTWQAPVSSNAGLPAISLIAGLDPKDKMPIGFELIAKQYAEPILIEMGYAYEQNSPKRKIPSMPAPNNQLIKFSIPELNALYPALGEKAYHAVLENGKPEDLTADLFQSLTVEAIDQMKGVH